MVGGGVDESNDAFRDTIHAGVRDCVKLKLPLTVPDGAAFR